MIAKIMYGIKYRCDKSSPWEWNATYHGICKYEDINKAYKDYENRIGFEWFIEEIPQELL